MSPVFQRRTYRERCRRECVNSYRERSLSCYTSRGTDLGKLYTSKLIYHMDSFNTKGVVDLKVQREKLILIKHLLHKNMHEDNKK